MRGEKLRSNIANLVTSGNLAEIRGHEDLASNPAILRDSQSVLDDFTMAGTTAGIYTDNAGWMTSGGDNGVILERNTAADAFFRMDNWKTLIISVWVDLNSVTLSAATNLFCWGWDQSASGTASGFSLSIQTSGKVRPRMRIDTEIASALSTTVLPASGATHLMGAFVNEGGGDFSAYAYVSGNQEDVESVTDSGSITALPTQGACMWCRGSGAAGVVPTGELLAGIMLSDMVFYRSEADITSSIATIAAEWAAIPRGFLPYSLP